MEADGGVPRFVTYFRVRHHEMDALGHVNNAVYLHYLEQAAIDHTTALGFPTARLRALGGVFIARRHEIDYLRPAAAGETLQVVTWPVEMPGARAVRDYEIRRHNPHGVGEDGAGMIPAAALLPPGRTFPGELIVRARTLWVWVDPETGWPRRLPAELRDTFLPRADH